MGLKRTYNTWLPGVPRRGFPPVIPEDREEEGGDEAAEQREEEREEQESGLVGQAGGETCLKVAMLDSCGKSSPLAQIRNYGRHWPGDQGGGPGSTGAGLHTGLLKVPMPRHARSNPSPKAAQNQRENQNQGVGLPPLDQTRLGIRGRQGPEEPLVGPLMFAISEPSGTVPQNREERGEQRIRGHGHGCKGVEERSEERGAEKVCVILLQPLAEMATPVLMHCFEGRKGPGRQSSLAALHTRQLDPRSDLHNLHDLQESGGTSGGVVRGTLPQVLREFQARQSMGSLLLAPDGEVLQLSLYENHADRLQLAHRDEVTEEEKGQEQLPWVSSLRPEHTQREGKMDVDQDLDHHMDHHRTRQHIPGGSKTLTAHHQKSSSWTQQTSANRSIEAPAVPQQDPRQSTRPCYPGRDQAVADLACPLVSMATEDSSTEMAQRTWNGRKKDVRKKRRGDEELGRAEDFSKDDGRLCPTPANSGQAAKTAANRHTCVTSGEEDLSPPSSPPGGHCRSRKEDRENSNTGQDLPGSQTGSRTHRDQKMRGRRGRSLSKQPQKGDRPIRDQEEERSDRQEDTETHNTAISMVTRDPRRERGEERRRRQTGVGGEERRVGRGRRGEGKQTVEEEEEKQPSVRKRRGRGEQEDFLVGKPQDSVLRDKRYQTKRETDRLNERQIERETDQETRRQTDREEDRYTERWTGRETCSKTSRQTERETSRETYRYTDSETDCSLLTAEWELSLVQSGSLPRSAVTTSSSQRSYPRSAFTNTSNQRSLRQAAAFCGGAGPKGSAGSMPSSAVMVTKEQLMLDLVQSEPPERNVVSAAVVRLDQQRAAQRVGKHRQEVEKKRREKEEEKRRQQEKEEREEEEREKREGRMREELEEERRRRAGEIRLKREREEEQQRVNEAENRERESQEQAKGESERRRVEERRRHAERLQRMREEEEKRRAVEQERLHQEENERREEENRRVEGMEEGEREEYLHRRQEEDEERRQVEKERRRREEEAALSALKEARRSGALFARQRALLEQQLSFKRGLLLEAEGLDTGQDVSRPWVYSYLALLDLLGLPKPDPAEPDL
ncbi:inner centromere protein A [Gadus macrocephalus]|uniref:inner centromere protein A n=1 Tax=Gadus macrocephalus TaxID=80720 RepID=UPI0028CB6A65|nr:inner centromere protein A [Gadus macrocephalus]